MHVGWSCPECRLVLAPHVAEHRCDPPSAGVTAAAPQPPFIPASGITITAPYAVSATTGHLGVAPMTHHRAADGTITEVNPGRLEITDGTAA